MFPLLLPVEVRFMPRPPLLVVRHKTDSDITKTLRQIRNSTTPESLSRPPPAGAGKKQKQKLKQKTTPPPKPDTPKKKKIKEKPENISNRKPESKINLRPGDSPTRPSVSASEPDRQAKGAPDCIIQSLWAYRCGYGLWRGG